MSFDQRAKTWDNDRRIKLAKIIATEIGNSLATNKELSAMEFGCGTGLISFNLYDKFKKITLIDSSKGMIDVLNAKIDEYKVSNMESLHLDITDENSLDIKFDVIYTSMVLHHIENTSSIINTFYKLLNEDGYLCIVDLDEEDGSFHKGHDDFHGHNGFNQEKLKDILIDAGFKAVESKTFYHGEKIVEDEKIDYSLFLMKSRK
ncbi:class I SAM-dependent DNA methyltransferase [Clostridium cellulovorans]|uniref:Methyltransferase type 12 n=1 Tax=Clostridium cellulovorans (strain ATCC 35296 / DSM 3052 / OCM 3 / 743B) TaxID=573061 RepID=D9SPM5_CLOC7|nr:class I SAM-dependent methyltransferase [Clostridium cellulovorans]ADL50074.1 Methyltransferase type 12 [Clostridium cellulovorans 743B]